MEMLQQDNEQQKMIKDLKQTNFIDLKNSYFRISKIHK